MVPYDHVWSPMSMYGPIWSVMVMYGPVWSYMVPYGLVWILVVLYVTYGLMWSCLHLFNSRNFCTNFVLVSYKNSDASPKKRVKKTFLFTEFIVIKMYVIGLPVRPVSSPGVSTYPPLPSIRAVQYASLSC